MNSSNTTEIPVATVKVTSADFDSMVLQAKGPVLVDFWAEWCGPCRMIGPVVDELAGTYAGRARVAKLDIDANPEIAARFAITGIPTLIVFKDGQPVERVMGAASRKTLAAKLDAHLN